MGSPQKVFIVEDHPVFREGMRQAIHNEDDLRVCGVADTAETAFKEIARLKPNLVLVDINLPGKSGLDLIKIIRRKDRAVKLLVVSMYHEALYADRVLRAGGDGYIMKQESPEEIINAVRDVLAGHIYVSEEVMTQDENKARKDVNPKTTGQLQRLTDLQLQILELLGQGRSDEEIAEELRSTASEIGVQCNQMRRKLRLKSNNALIRYAVCWAESGAI